MPVSVMCACGEYAKFENAEQETAKCVCGATCYNPDIPRYVISMKWGGFYGEGRHFRDLAEANTQRDRLNDAAKENGFPITYFVELDTTHFDRL